MHSEYQRCICVLFRGACIDALVCRGSARYAGPGMHGVQDDLTET